MEESRSAFKILQVNLQERDLRGGLSVDGRTILEWILKRCINTGNWVDSAQDRDYWRDLVNAALNLRVQ